MFKAYHNWLKKRGDETWKLPGISLTNEQLFYVGFGQVSKYPKSVNNYQIKKPDGITWITQVICWCDAIESYHIMADK